MLPDLLRRLVFATVPREHLQKIDFPAGAETQRPGYDGTTVTGQGTAFVPNGVGFWELGCVIGNPKGKAQRDYNNRIAEHKERVVRGETENLKQATFIAVTPVDWQGASAWAEERLRDGHFGSVRAYDSNQLEHWIQDAPAVGLWIAQEVLGYRDGVTDIASHWHTVQATLRHPLPPKVLLVNRERIGEAFDGWLRCPGVELAVKAPSRAELVAVFCAWVQTLPAERQDEISSRSIIVETRANWSALVTSTQKLILIASPRLEADADLFGDACRNGHHVLRFADFREPRNQATEMPLMRRFDLQNALQEAGLSEQDARHYAKAAGGNFTILRRRFAKTPDQAPWSRDPNLAPLLLAAAWEDGCSDDQRIVSELAEKKYSEVQAVMTKWRAEPDPPVRSVLGNWEFLSPVDAWEALHSYLTTTHMDRFERLAVEVLTEENPALDLPPEERLMSSLKGKVWHFSGALRRGIAEILALAATREEASSVAVELQFATRASCIVRKVLPTGCGWRRWASLDGLIPLLLEAAPDVVLAAIEKDIHSPNPQLVELIKQEIPGAVVGRIYHSGVLWALETAAWPEEQVLRASICLAHLAKLDPGGTWANRPLASLTNIFFSWRPQTNISVEKRIAALRSLDRKEPEAAWKLVLALLPEHREVMRDSAKPVYRDWAAGWTGKVTDGDYRAFITEVSTMAVEMANAESTRWPDLLGRVTRLPRVDFQKVVSGLTKLSENPPHDPLKTSIWNKLREIVRMHKNVLIPDLALPKEAVSQLAAFVDKFAPTDLVALYAPLFNDDGWMDGGHSESYEEKQARRERERRQAIREMWRLEGEAIILELARQVKEPMAVGWSLAGEMGTEVMAKIIPMHLTSETKAIQFCAARFALERIHANGRDWAEAQPSAAWTPGQVTAWALQMPMDPRTWDWVALQGETVKKDYWNCVGTWEHPGLPFPARSRAAAEFQAAGRAWSALKLLMQAKYYKCPLTHTIVCEALETVAKSPEERVPGSMDVHYIHEAFEFLQSASDIDESRVARLEFEFLPFLDRFSRLPLTLQRCLSKEPEFFVECLKILYKEHSKLTEGKDNESEQTPDQGKAEKAKRIWRLLRDWRVIPGTGQDGKVSVDALRTWIRSAREKARAVDRLNACDITVGELFACSPHDDDKAKPVVAIREVIEECESAELESGFAMGLHNLRGCFSKGLYEGGKQERELAAEYERYAAACASWPRTAAVLRAVSQDYIRQADHEDERARTRD
jgi:hypothetical protein